MRITPLIAGAVSSAVAIVAITAVFAQSGSNDGSASTRKRYLPEYTASGDLMLPKNFNEPLDEFIAETMSVLATDADEILVDRAKAFRANVGPKEHGLVDSFNHEATERFATT
jgi:hypothetical protein